MNTEGHGFSLFPIGAFRKSQVFLWICVTILLFLFVVWFPIGGFVAGIFTPLPSSLAVYQWGVPMGLVVPVGALITGGILLTLTGGVVALPYLGLFLLMGSLIGFYGRLNRSLDYSVFVPVVIVFSLGAVFFWLRARGVEGSVWDLMADKIIKLVIILAKERGGAGFEITPYLEEQIRRTVNLMVRLLPGISFASLLLTGAINALSTRRFAFKNHLPLPNWQEASRWRSPDWFVWIVIGAGFLTFVPQLRIGGLNILIGSGMVYLFQGLSVLLFYMTRWRIPAWGRMIILFLVITQQYLAIAAAFLGLFDVWFDIRRLQRKTNEEIP